MRNMGPFSLEVPPLPRRTLDRNLGTKGPRAAPAASGASGGGLRRSPCAPDRGLELVGDARRFVDRAPLEPPKSRQR